MQQRGYQSDEHVEAQDEDASVGPASFRRGNHESSIATPPSQACEGRSASGHASCRWLASGEPVGNPLLPEDDLNGIAPIALQLDVEILY